MITVCEAARNPYFNMVRHDTLGHAHLVMESGEEVTRRQDTPSVFDMTTIAYAARPDFITGSQRIFDGRVRSVLVPRERALDIDTPYDFMLAECMASAAGRIPR